MNRVEPLDESVGTNSTALLEDVSQESPEVKDVPTDYVNLEDNPSIEEDQNNGAVMLEKSESVEEDREVIVNETQEKYIFNSNHSSSNISHRYGWLAADSQEFAKQSSFFFVRNPETAERNSIEETGNIDTRTEDDPKPDDQFDSKPR